MVMVTAITNFMMLPTIVVLFKQKKHVEFNVGVFTFISSYYYHMLDSLTLFTFFMDIDKWHILDNIGSISCLAFMIIHLLKVEDKFINNSLKVIAVILAVTF